VFARIAEDGTWADVNDREITVPEGASLGVPHPLELPPDVRARWSDVFLSYEILPPFEQLGRAVYDTLDPSAYANARAADAAPFMLETLGWHVSAAYDETMTLELELRGASAWIEIVGDAGARTVTAVTVEGGDAVARSEIRRALEKIVRR
jgi:hypothetical protein